MTVEIEVTVPDSVASVEVTQTGAPGQNGTNGTNGLDGKSAYEVAVQDGFVGTEVEWLASLHGADGSNGSPGAPGSNGESPDLQVADGYIQWKFPTDATWNNLIAVATLVGPKGDTGSAGANGTDGTDGREIEVQNSGTAIQWRYAGDATWTDLVALTAITGPQGNPGSNGSDGAPGVDGKTILSGSGAPSGTLGVDGDFYVDTTAHAIYGPKASGAWGSGTSLIGPTGNTGSNGTNGTDGTNGATWRQGSGAPSNTLGVYGDFYFRTDTSDVYQRASGTYSVIANIKGATGSTGPAGAAGSLAATDYGKTTGSLANGAYETGTWAPSSAQVHEVLKVTVDRAARVRFYDSTAHRDADVSRAVGTDPTGDSGLLLEANLPVGGNLYATPTSAVRLFEVAALGAVPYTITNLSGATSTVTLTLRAKGWV